MLSNNTDTDNLIIGLLSNMDVINMSLVSKYARMLCINSLSSEQSSNRITKAIIDNELLFLGLAQNQSNLPFRIGHYYWTLIYDRLIWFKWLNTRICPKPNKIYLSQYINTFNPKNIINYINYINYINNDSLMNIV